MTLDPGTLIGHYEIKAQLGAGGMGEVYLATDTRLDRQVAIKALPAHLATDPDRLARFQREAKVLASLNHPNIAQIYGIEESTVQGPASGASSAVRALVMELVDGDDLARNAVVRAGAADDDQAVLLVAHELVGHVAELVGRNPSDSLDVDAGARSVRAQCLNETCCFRCHAASFMS